MMGLLSPVGPLVPPASCPSAALTATRKRVWDASVLLRHIQSWLFLPELAGARRVCRQWLECASPLFRDVWLEWFLDIPLGGGDLGRKQALDHLVVIAKTILVVDSKAQYDADLVRRCNLAMSMQPLANPDWKAEARRLYETPLDAGSWGRGMAQWFATHCGMCGDEVDDQVGP